MATSGTPSSTHSRQPDAVAVALGTFCDAVSTRKAMALAMTDEVIITHCPGMAVTSHSRWALRQRRSFIRGTEFAVARPAQRSVAAHGVALVERATTNRCEGEPEIFTGAN